MTSKWMDRFIDGRETTKEEDHSGRPVTISKELTMSAI